MQGGGGGGGGHQSRHQQRVQLIEIWEGFKWEGGFYGSPIMHAAPTSKKPMPLKVRAVRGRGSAWAGRLSGYIYRVADGSFEQRKGGGEGGSRLLREDI